MEKRIVDCIGEPAMLEQLAEEAAELSQAALKLARIKRGENPTPVTEVDALLNLIEEYTDVCLCVRELEISDSPVIALRKRDRFWQRWEERQEKHDSD